LGVGSTLPRASSVAGSSSAVSSSVKSRIFFWRADWGIARNRLAILCLEVRRPALQALLGENRFIGREEGSDK